MKKIFSIFLASLFLFGCDDWLDVNTDPNTPTDVTPELLLPSAENAIATRLGGNIYNFAGIFAQYFAQAPQAEQYDAIDNYGLKFEFLNIDYGQLYFRALEDLETIRRKTQGTKHTGLYLAATALKAYTFQMLVDMMDKTPYTEALQGAANTMPKWDDGMSVYSGLISEINEALGLVDENSFIPKGDLLLNSNMDQWVGFAKAMKLKLFMRESYATDRNKQNLINLINENDFFTGDIVFNVYSDDNAKRNPWYETNKIGLPATNIIASYPIITYMSSNNDPRLKVVFRKDDKKSYSGNIPGWKDRPNAKASNFSTPIITATTPVYLYTQTELQLFISEAKLRFLSDKPGAQTAYEKAIDSNLQLHKLTVSGSDLYGAGKSYEWNAAGTLEENIEQIMMQKWVSLCLVNHFEAWTEMRRLHYPEPTSIDGTTIPDDPSAYTPGTLISPVGNNLGAGNFPIRLPYPEIARTTNSNTPRQSTLAEANLTPVWWDKK